MNPAQETQAAERRSFADTAIVVVRQNSGWGEISAYDPNDRRNLNLTESRFWKDRSSFSGFDLCQALSSRRDDWFYEDHNRCHPSGYKVKEVFMDETILLEFAAVRRRTNLNDYDKRFLANCFCRIVEGKDLTHPQKQLLHRMYVGPPKRPKEDVQRVGYTLIDNSTGKKVYL